jgi:hypothetical protein
MKKLIALSLISLFVSGCASTPEPKTFLGMDWYNQMKLAVNNLGIECDAWDVTIPEDGIVNSVTCSEDIRFFGGYLILDENKKDSEGFMKTMAEYAAKDYKRSSTYASNWMIIASSPDLEKIASAFGSTVVKAN